jgi:hypothetical protein
LRRNAARTILISGHLKEGAVDIAHRRAFLLALPQAALTAACGFGAARGSTSKPTDAASPAGTGSEPQPPVEPPTQEPGASSWRVRPLPVEGDRAWLQEWLDLVALPSTKGTAGC